MNYILCSLAGLILGCAIAYLHYRHSFRVHDKIVDDNYKLRQALAAQHAAYDQESINNAMLQSKCDELLKQYTRLRDKDETRTMTVGEAVDSFEQQGHITAEEAKEIRRVWQKPRPRVCPPIAVEAKERPLYGIFYTCQCGAFTHLTRCVGCNSPMPFLDVAETLRADPETAPIVRQWVETMDEQGVADYIRKSIGETPPDISVIAGWTTKQRERVVDYCTSLHLSIADTDIKVPPRPAFFPTV